MDWKDKNKLIEAVKNSCTITEVLKYLKINHNNVGNRQRLFKYLTSYDIDISHLKNSLRHSGVWKSMKREFFVDLVRTSTSMSEILRGLGLKIKGSSLMTLKKYMKFFNVDLSEIGKTADKNKKKIGRWTNEEVFIENSKATTASAKNRILEQSLIEYKCSKCNNDGNWLNEKLVLQLEHKNGKNNDHRLENLEFLCPNCHTQTKTWGCKNICKTTK